MDQDEVDKREQIQAENAQETAPYGGSQTNAKRDGRWLAITTALMTTVIAIATVVYAYYSYGLWRATKETTELTRELFRATNRPYVGITTHDIYEDKENKNIRVFLHLKNSGNIPASDVITNFIYHPSKEGEYKEGIDGIPGGAKPLVLFPNGTIALPIRFSGEIWVSA